MAPESIAGCLEQLRGGGCVLIVDSAAEPPEAVLGCAAARVTPPTVNFLVTHARGLVCLVLPPARMRQLGIPLIGPRAGATPAYGASIEARQGVSTGISASDRATTILAAVAADATSADLVMPGHVTPIQAAQGGTLVCAALPEAASDLVRLAGMGAEAVVCAVLGLSGNLASAAELDALATRHGLPRVSISEVIQMRLRSDTLVRRVAEAMLELGFREDLRDYGIGAQILRDLGVHRVRLLTNNPQKIGGLESYGVHVVARAPLEVAPHPGNIEYLRTKQAKLGHLLSGLQRTS